MFKMKLRYVVSLIMSSLLMVVVGINGSSPSLSRVPTSVVAHRVVADEANPPITDGGSPIAGRTTRFYLSWEEHLITTPTA